MMDKTESEIVKMVYNRFISSEEEIWTELDDNIEMVGWLSDDWLIKEARIKFEEHSTGIFRCKSDHKIEHCFAPIILESVGYILDLYDKTGELHIRNRYILEFYISMSELRMIFKTD